MSNARSFKVRGIDISTDDIRPRSIADVILPFRIAILGQDYRNLRFQLRAEEGETVAAGDVIFTDRQRADLRYVAPASGVITQIQHRGKRNLDYIEITLNEREGRKFSQPEKHDRQSLTELLVEGGAWQFIKTRPFDDTPKPGAIHDALFVTAIDTRPFAPDPAVVISRFESWFVEGLRGMQLLTDGPVYLCQAPGVSLPAVEGVTHATFAGPHPAGLPGTHIHHLHPIHNGRKVWHIGYQDVIAIGHLLNTNRIWTRRVVSIAGRGIKTPRLIETVPGANLNEICSGSDIGTHAHFLSGSPLDGRIENYLARGHLQATAVSKNSTDPQKSLRRLASMLHNWLLSGGNAIIPNVAHERAAPAGIFPIPFLRAISVGDTETAKKLGALTLAEEDLALLTYVDGGKTDFGALLRQTLDELRKAA